jgi:membrane protease YdiL (CAAX protease family)
MLFWFLLLGSWQFLASPGKVTSVIGTAGTAWFLVSAWKSLGRLRGFGMHQASWEPAHTRDWIIAVATGFGAGGVIFGVAWASGQNVMFTADWRLVMLQVALGPVLEEIVFRGYLFAALIWFLRRFAGRVLPNRAVIFIAALVFALVHLVHPGVSWLELACIASTGTLYGWIRWRSGSTAPAAASHAVYNMTLYAAVAITAAGR